jgi:hypothetical protein
MGNNLPAKKYKSGSRTIRNLRFVFTPGADTEVSKYIDLAQCLSAINRRSYRQGLYYYVSGVTIHNSSNAWVRVATLPDSWSVKNAHRRGFKIFQRMNNEAMALTGDITPKYHDFKIAMHSGHSGAWANNLLPCGSETDGSNVVTCDEWIQSKFCSNDPAMPDPTISDIFTAHMLGGGTAGAGAPDVHATVGLLRSYASSRVLPNATDPLLPSDVSTDPLTNLFDSGDSHDDVIANLDADNDVAPYDASQHWGEGSADDTLVQVQCATGAGSSSVARAGGFCAPMGLLQIITQETPATGDSSIGSIEVNIQVAPGPYHGVYAERV